MNKTNNRYWQALQLLKQLQLLHNAENDMLGDACVAYQIHVVVMLVTAVTSR